MITAYTAARIFTGDNWLDNHSVITEDGIITGIVPTGSLDKTSPHYVFSDAIIAPAFIDLQVYGAGGKLFSVYQNSDALAALVEHEAKGGAVLCLPTAATNTKEVFYNCIDAVRAYWKEGGQGVLGLHLEGPWINPVKRGAHIEALIHPPTITEVNELLEYGHDVIKMVTLAPEVCSPEIIAMVRSHGIVISAGHSNATYEEANKGFANGITAVTHLFNAMSPLQHREPGLAGAAMDHATAMASIIPDGYHVDFAAVRIAKAVMKDRLFAITDAVTATSDGYYQHYAAGDKYEAAGILSGSALTMNKALQNLVQYAGIETGEALRMCGLYPAQTAGISHKYGKVEKGFTAAFAVLDPSLDVIQLVR